ncbi:hypothetical protein B0H16DRAFT_1719583 [Mycena metata]|uniref:Homeobox domain-containing protein n=1 Tax=Mycena metata TaxID=1033252 RepID=A0AAD7NHM8_9AGAR|nr:hypothetical protein B0H16DRAFT_1719583 [Mycena metata]
MSDEDAARLGEATAARKRQIKSWFNNRGQKTKREQTGVDGGKQGSLAIRLFKNLKKKTRRLQEIEIYQKRNRAKIRKAVKAALVRAGRNSDSDDSGSSSSDDSDSSSDSDTESSDPPHTDNLPKAGRFKKTTAKAKVKLDRSKGLSVRRKVVAELFENESEEEKANVRQAYEAQEAAPKDEEFEKSAGERTPEEIQSAIDELGGIIGEFHAAIYRVTGWLGVTVLGGPMPEEGGSISQKTYSSGESPAGLSLPQSLQDWDRVLAGTGQWLKRVNSREVRKARAITRTKADDTSAILTVVPKVSTPAPAPATEKGKGKLPKAPKTKRISQKMATVVADASAADVAAVYGAAAADFAPSLRDPDDPMEGVDATGNDVLAQDNINWTSPASTSDNTDSNIDTWAHGNGAGLPPDWMQTLDPLLFDPEFDVEEGTPSDAEIISDTALDSFSTGTPAPEAVKGLDAAMTGFIYNASSTPLLPTTGLSPSSLASRLAASSPPSPNPSGLQSPGTSPSIFFSKLATL